FVLDILRQSEAEFRAAVADTVPGADVHVLPNMRARILAYGPEAAMTRVAGLAEIPDDAWQLRGERGISYAEEVPEGSTITAGTWWPEGYTGEPLVSVDADLAQALGLNIGDRLTVSLLGVERGARIASFRRLE